jgi:ABC transporter transmembrane region
MLSSLSSLLHIQTRFQLCLASFTTPHTYSSSLSDLISRLTVGTNVVSKSLTQNISEGRRPLTTSVAGLSMMLYVSPQLTGIMMLIETQLPRLLEESSAESVSILWNVNRC